MKVRKDMVQFLGGEYLPREERQKLELAYRDAVIEKFGVDEVLGAWKAYVSTLEAHGTSPAHIKDHPLPETASPQARADVERWTKIDLAGRAAASFNRPHGHFELFVALS